MGVCQGERGRERTRKVTEERPEERRMSIREARGERKKSERLQRPSQVKRQISNKNLLAQEARKYSQKAKTTPEKKGCPEKVNRKIKETNEKTEEPKGEVTSSPREARRGERPPPLELPLSSSISSLCLSLAEVGHILEQETRAGLEERPLNPALKAELAGGSLCAVCASRRFTLLNWARSCCLCRSSVCSSCISSLRLPFSPLPSLTVASLLPQLLPSTPSPSPLSPAPASPVAASFLRSSMDRLSFRSSKPRDPIPGLIRSNTTLTPKEGEGSSRRMVRSGTLMDLERRGVCLKCWARLGHMATSLQGGQTREHRKALSKS